METSGGKVSGRSSCRRGQSVAECWLPFDHARGTCRAHRGDRPVRLACGTPAIHARCLPARGACRACHVLDLVYVRILKSAIPAHLLPEVQAT